MRFCWKHMLCVGVAAGLAGCGGNESDDKTAAAGGYETLPAPAPGEEATYDGPGSGGGGGAATAGREGGGGDAKPGGSDAAGSVARIEENRVALTPATTRIVFIGTHSDPQKPDPRTCGFEKFSGEAVVKDGNVTSIEVDIDTDSIFSFNPSLTQHLKNADFFEVNEYPAARFESTKIEGAAPNVTVTGKLTLRGVTREVSFPATVAVTDEALTLGSEFKINRFDFGMNGVRDRVLPDVTLRIAVGQPTNKEEILASTGGAAPEGRRGGGGGRGFDPMAMFAQQDANSDGKLSGDEIPERMRGMLDRIDSNSDGDISKEEMEEMTKRFRGGAGGRPGGEGGAGSGRPQRPGQ